MASQIERIVLIGAGRVATQLGLAFRRNGVQVVQVVNRSPERGRTLARKLGCSYVSQFGESDRSADLYLIAVTDSAIATVAGEWTLPGDRVAHTSGTVGMDALARVSEDHGVFYPLQTFPAGKTVSLRNVPVCIEAVKPRSAALLAGLAHRISNTVVPLAGEKRRALHLAAVIAANFSHFMYVVAEDVLREHGLPLGLLQPLIESTAQNVRRSDLIRFQTGPAIRGDATVLSEHRLLLRDHPDYLEIYNLITSNIVKFKSQHGKL